MGQGGLIYSCVIDANPRFAFEAWGLVNSLVRLAGVAPGRIVVHHTDEVDRVLLAEFESLGVIVRRLARSVDGAYCNKIGQLSSPELQSAEGVALMDADMIALEGLDGLMAPGVIRGKVVDLENPDIGTLRRIFELAGFRSFPGVCRVDMENAETFRTNLNGGLYVVPGNLASALGSRWKRWALWLFENISLLAAVGKQQHVDQVSFALAAHDLGIPVEHVARRYNCPIHLPGEIRGYPAVLHYHRSVSRVGLLESAARGDDEFERAIADANRLLGASFNNRVFWSFRYRMYPELGSGVGSRGENLKYKRTLLEQLGIERSRSILDVGCGDLEVLAPLDLHGYTGIDVSPEAIRIARAKRPDLRFVLLDDGSGADIPSAETVLCLEVLIHQQARSDYDRLVAFLAEKTERTLIVSGYAARHPGHESNHMLKFHEPLIQSLRRTNKFSKIEIVGRHSDLDILMATI